MKISVHTSYYILKLLESHSFPPKKHLLLSNLVSDLSCLSKLSKRQSNNKHTHSKLTVCIQHCQNHADLVLHIQYVHMLNIAEHQQVLVTHPGELCEALNQWSTDFHFRMVNYGFVTMSSVLSFNNIHHNTV